MIFTSWPAVSCPMSTEAPISRMANATRLYSTLSRTDSRKALRAMRRIVAAMAAAGRSVPGRAVAVGRVHVRDEEILERVAQGRE